MDLTTRCPHCGTTFAASLEQLQLRKGYIRCVQCAHIFDGYEAVVPAPGVGTDVKRPEAGGTTPPAPRERASRQLDEPHVDSLQAPASIPAVVRGRREFTISDQTPVDAPDEPFWTVPDGADAPPSAHTPAVDHGSIDLDHIRVDSGHDDFDPDHIRIEPDPLPADNEHVVLGPQEKDSFADYTEAWRKSLDGPSSWWQSLVRLVWILVIAAGVLLFAAQLVYVYRAQIAENIPALRPVLERMCVALDCAVPYSRQIDLIVITQSSLQQDPGEDEDGTGEILLQFTLRNVHDRPQEWPTLVLDLKDFSGALIARKHLSKNDYLPAELAEGPFPANSERMVALPLTVQDLQVNGYQLTAFFP